MEASAAAGYAAAASSETSHTDALDASHTDARDFVPRPGPFPAPGQRVGPTKRPRPRPSRRSVGATTTTATPLHPPRVLSVATQNLYNEIVTPHDRRGDARIVVEGGGGSGAGGHARLGGGPERQPSTSTRSSARATAPAPMAHLLRSIGRLTGKPRVRLPQREEDSGKLCVVLDMDETLIHSIFSDPGNVYRQAEARKNASSDDVESFELLMEDGDRATVNLRPGLKEFLEQGAEHFELMVFTAGLKCYAQPLLNVIDPGGAAFRARLFRGSCTQVPGVGFVKDLALANRDPGRVVLVDNNPISCVPQPDNGIPIASFFDDKDDRALEELLALLISLKDVKDVRPALRKKFGLRRELAGYDRMMKASSPSSVTSFGDVLF